MQRKVYRGWDLFKVHKTAQRLQGIGVFEAGAEQRNNLKSSLKNSRRRKNVALKNFRRLEKVIVMLTWFVPGIQSRRVSISLRSGHESCHSAAPKRPEHRPTEAYPCRVLADEKTNHKETGNP